MQRTSLAGSFRFAGLLLILLIALVGNYRATVPTNLPAMQNTADECAGLAKDCQAPVRYLGESKGCACFACEYGRKTQRILCSADEAEKNRFRALLPKT